MADPLETDRAPTAHSPESAPAEPMPRTYRRSNSRLGMILGGIVGLVFVTAVILVLIYHYAK